MGVTAGFFGPFWKICARKLENDPLRSCYPRDFLTHKLAFYVCTVLSVQSDRGDLFVDLNSNLFLIHLHIIASGGCTIFMWDKKKE